jgi:hypothetical protein
MPKCYKKDCMKSAPGQNLPLVRLGLLTAASLAIHGYHLGVDDAEIYLPAVSKLIHPSLFPYGADFFLAYQRLSLFAPILAWSARLTHLSTDWTVFCWYIATLFATLVACWMLAAVCFDSARARWCSVLAVSAALTMPAANTGLLLMDPYVTARSFSTPLTLFALAGFLGRRYGWAALAAVLTAAIHPQMAAYLVLLGAILWMVEKLAPAKPRQAPAAALAIFLPLGFRFSPAQGPYREALYARDFYFLSTWTWYDWLGLVAPLAILAWFWKAKPRGTTPAFARLSLALIPYGVISILPAAVISSSHFFDMFARLQPLRCFHLITLVFVLFLGGVVGEYAATAVPESLYPGAWMPSGVFLKKTPPFAELRWARQFWNRSKKRLWMVAVLFLSVAVGMFAVARQTYPYSPHIEWPWLKTGSNAWVNTLLWVRRNTPRDAVFAVDSRYFEDAGVDKHGFRAISRRSALADYFKDGGAVAIFPDLAVEWKQMSDVTWAVIHGPAPAGMACPYRQQGYALCKIPDAPGLAPEQR